MRSQADRDEQTVRITTGVVLFAIAVGLVLLVFDLLS
jgi:preprotein translocase subunit SecE